MIKYSKRKSIFIKDIFNVLNSMKITFDIFGNVHLIIYEEFIITDFIYYYLRNYDCKKIKVYNLNGNIIDALETPYFYMKSNYIADYLKYLKSMKSPYFNIVVDKKIINDGIFIKDKNIKSEITGALFLNVLFPLLKKYKVKLNSIDNIDNISIYLNLNTKFITGLNKYIIHENYVNIYDNFDESYLNSGYNTFRWMSNHFNVDGNGNVSFYGWFYNIIHESTINNDHSILLDMFYYNFIILIKNKDSSCILISNNCLDKYDNNKYKVVYISSDIDILYFNENLNINDFIIEFCYYNNLPIPDTTHNITINSEQLFKYNNVIKPWAHKNIYPKINDINVYNCIGIQHVLCNPLDEYIKQIDNIKKYNFYCAQ